jgi:hypothetical protein
VPPLIEALNFIELTQLGKSTSLANKALHNASTPKIYGECTFHGPCIQNGKALCQKNRLLPDLYFDKIVDEADEEEENDEEHLFEFFNDIGKTVLKNW